MNHHENAKRVLAQWQSRPRRASLVRGLVYDAGGNLIYSGDYMAGECGGFEGAAEQLGREASLFTDGARYVAVVADICVLGADRVLPTWCGAQRAGTCASAVTPDDIEEGGMFSTRIGQAFWNAYLFSESEVTI